MKTYFLDVTVDVIIGYVAHKRILNGIYDLEDASKIDEFVRNELNLNSLFSNVTVMIHYNNIQLL